MQFDGTCPDSTSADCSWRAPPSIRWRVPSEHSPYGAGLVSYIGVGRLAPGLKADIVVVARRDDDQTTPAVVQGEGRARRLGGPAKRPLPHQPEEVDDQRGAKGDLDVRPQTIYAPFDESEFISATSLRLYHLLCWHGSNSWWRLQSSYEDHQACATTVIEL
jgi:adenine deaminase